MKTSLDAMEGFATQSVCLGRPVIPSSCCATIGLRRQHAGTNQVLAQLSVQYWIISAREAIREWERECMQCRRRKASPAKQIMAPLPELRTRKSLRAFSHISVDFGGPFLTKQGRGKTRQKRYLCLFTCLQTRAVHLEVAFSLDTDAFQNVFYGMTSRRGLGLVVCDNGTRKK